MLPSRFDATYLLIALGLGAVLLVQAWLIRRRPAWPGGIVPVGYLGLLAYLAATGRLAQLVDWVFAALGLLALLAWWAGARRQRVEETEDAAR